MPRAPHWPAREPASRHVGRLTSPEIQARLSPRSVLCLPIGAYEQHGPHLPVYTDTILAEGFSYALIDRWGEQYDVWLLPTIPFGLSREHSWSPGTISLSVAAFTDLFLSVCESVAAAVPARNLLIVNGHGGNRGILEALLYEIQARFSFNACVTHPTALSRVRSGSAFAEVHGGMSETSVMLALAGSEVHLDRVPESCVPDGLQAGIRQLILDRGVTWPWTSDDEVLASSGIIGDALKADAALGERIVESAIEEYGNVLSLLVARGESHGRA